MKTDSVTAKDRHVINSSPLVDTKYENIWGVFGQLILGLYTILLLNIYCSYLLPSATSRVLSWKRGLPHSR